MARFGLQILISFKMTTPGCCGLKVNFEIIMLKITYIYIGQLSQ